ncbi:tyrosine-type recombinase/integrase [Cryptosporangium aurantiacum]|uniref:Site-specific recombinase XerD n=1 Tax=Cryptosporangium aurantiacum TaxID=134849 RepID=A0A1M7NMS9_9ACTN|nr:site-specific integrase [Cryptosporangium aurantiacum]SHN04814.1 Site-specific recombinase XerD [Cryptosporangium aurantiacum]
MTTPKKATRRPNGASSIYEGSDGWWHGRVTVGVKDNGKEDRRHVRGRTEKVVIRKVRELEKERDSGKVRKIGAPWTVAEWLTHWLHNVAQPSVRQSSYSAYEVAVRVHLIPGIGAHRLDRLTPEHLESLYKRMVAKGSSAGTAHQAHRTIRTALGVADRRGYLPRGNPAARGMAKAPRIEEEEIEPYTVEEVRRLLAVAGKRPRNSARWAMALALGLRQGEVLGLKWSDVDLDAGTLRVSRGRQRPKYEHGCGGSCGRKPGYCKQRKNVRPDTADTKSRAGKRPIGLPAELVALLRQHKAAQEAERAKAAQLWRDEGWLFATPTGGVLSTNTDYHEWKDLLKDAGIRDGRLHDARHTAATVLLLLGVPDRAVMGLMGWSNTAMAARYQHLTAKVRHDIAKQVGGLIWQAEEDTEKAN